MKNINTPTAQIIAEVANAAATQAIDYELEDVTIMWDYASEGARKTVLQVEFADHLVVLVRLEDANGQVEWTHAEARYSEPKQLLSEALAA